MTSTTAKVIKLPLKGLDAATEDLLFWKSPLKTGVVLAVISVGFLAIQTLSRLVLSMSMTIGAFLAWAFLGGLVHRPMPSFPRMFTEGIAEADMRRMVEKMLPYVNKTLHFVHRILSGKDVLMSVALSAGLFFASRVLATVSLLGLAYAGVVLVFTVPKVYEMYHEQIDGGINLFRQKATFIYDAYLAKVLKMIPTAVNQATPAESSTTAVGERNKDD